MGGEVSTDFKSSNGIEISRLVQVLLNFYWFRGSPRGDGWVGGWRWGLMRRCPLHTHAHARAHTHACACIWHHREFPGIPQKSNGSSHLHEIIMLTTHACVCVCMCACVCMCTCVGGSPQPPPTTIHPTPHPQSCTESKTQKFNKSWTNRDNLILFEDSLSLNIPELI